MSEGVLKTMIINRQAAVDRRALQIKQMDELNLTYEFLNATEPHSLSEHFKSLRFWKTPLRLSELSCFESHCRCWIAATKAKQNTMLVLEDDFIFRCDKIDPQAIHAWVQKQNIPIILSLEAIQHPKTVYTQHSGTISGHAVFRILWAPNGAGAYIINAQAAEILVKRSQKTIDAVDIFFNNHRDIHMFQMDPAIGHQALYSPLFGTHTKIDFSVSSTHAYPLQRTRPWFLSAFYILYLELRRRLIKLRVYLLEILPRRIFFITRTVVIRRINITHSNESKNCEDNNKTPLVDR
jgi:GR25 family glycosyltransferase involved in LPS biosynthesis